MNEHDDLTTQLSRSLGDHADVMTGSSLGLAEVKGRARGIRRRRAASAVVAAAAAVAIVVPTVALASHTGGKPEPAPVVTPTPTPTATVDGPAPGVLDVSGLPIGAAPRMDYVHDGTLHMGEGGTATLRTRYAPSQFVEMEDGSRVWLTADDGTPYIEIQDADGSFHDPVPSDWSLEINPAHTIAAWLTPHHQVMIWEGRASEPRPVGDPISATDLRIAAVSGDDCALACTVYANVPDAGGWRPWEISDSATQMMRDGGYVTLDDVNQAGITVGETEVSEEGACSKLSGGGEFAGFSTCRNSFTRFSPDGQLVLAEPPYYDGPGPGGIGMYDLDGTRLFYRSATAHVQSYYAFPAVWEDDTHALAPVYQNGRWALVRFSSDGSMEYAVPPVKGRYEDSGYVLPTGGDVSALGR